MEKLSLWANLKNQKLEKKSTVIIIILKSCHFFVIVLEKKNINKAQLITMMTNQFSLESDNQNLKEAWWWCTALASEWSKPRYCSNVEIFPLPPLPAIKVSHGAAAAAVRASTTRVTPAPAPDSAGQSVFEKVLAVTHAAQLLRLSLVSLSCFNYFSFIRKCRKKENNTMGTGRSIF